MLPEWEDVRKLAYKMVESFTGFAEREDLRQEAYICFAKAAEDYDPAQGVPFANFYASRLRWHWFRYIEQSGSGLRLPNWIFWTVIKYRRTVSDFVKENGREPTENQLCELMDIKPAELHTIRDTIKKRRVRSIYEPIGGTDDLTLQDSIQDPTDCFSGILDKVEGEQLASVLWELVDRLPNEQAEAIRAAYNPEGEPLTEYCKRTGKDYARTAAQKAAGLNTLRYNHKYNKALREFWQDDRRYNMGVRGVGVGVFNRTHTSATERAALWDFLRDHTAEE